MQRMKDGFQTGKDIAGAGFRLGVETAGGVGVAFLGDKFLQATHALNIPGGVTTEFAQMGALPALAVARSIVERKFSKLLIPSMAAFGSAAYAWSHFHSQEAMWPAYGIGLAASGLGEYAVLRMRRNSKKAAKPQAH